MSDQQPPSSPGWAPPGQSQPPTAPWTPPPGEQPPTFTPSGGTQIPPPPPSGGQGPWQSQPPPPPGGQGPWPPQGPTGPQGQWQPGQGGEVTSKTPLILAGVGAVIVIVLIGAFIALSGDDDKDKDATTTTSATAATSTTQEEDPTTTEEEDPTTTEVPSGELEVPEPISGYQVYEDPAGEFALTFPDDWNVTDGSDAGLSSASLVVVGPAVDGFSANLNLLTTPGANDGELPIDGETQADTLSQEDAFQNVAAEDVSIGDRDGFVITFTYDDGTSRYEGYQYYAGGESDIYILTVAMPVGSDRTVADDIGESLRVI